MLTEKIIRRAVRNEVESRIYTRGLNYFHSGMVISWTAEKMGEDLFLISGKVRGSRNYSVELVFDAELGIFSEMNCSCPYGDTCKHTVALGLTFAESFNNPTIAPPKIEKNDSKSSLDKNRLLKTLEDLGLAAEAVPNDLIAQLLSYQKTTPTISPPQKTLTTAPHLSDPKKYFILLSTHNCRPRFCRKTFYNYEEASIKQILEQKNLSAEQQELLNYLQNNFPNNSNPATKPDLATLVPLLAKGGFPVFNDLDFDKKWPLKFDLQPTPLKAEIVHEAVPIGTNEDKIRHDFSLRMPAEYWANKDYWYDSPFGISGQCLARNLGKIFELHQLTPLLTEIIARLEPAYDHTNWRQPRKTKYYQTDLNSEEVTKFDQLINDAVKHLELTSAPPIFKTQALPAEPRPAIRVDFNALAQTLRVTPVFDYGVHQQDISETVYLSRRDSGSVLNWRPTFENPGDHIISIVEDTIHHATIAKDREIKFYQELTEQALEFGFTKTLKCQKHGHSAVEKYLNDSWPKLAAFCQQQNYPIIFSQDELSFKSAIFRADFSTKIEADNDWLYFDLACYCNDERVTLEKLLAFLDSGQPFWRRDDGSLVKITNRQELERLARLLQNFHAKENGGFEGQLRQAPELEYVMTSSEHYNALRAKSFKDFLAHVQSGKPIKKVALPKKLTKILRPYQKQGIDWLYFLRSHRFAGILGDDMGLGKTLQALAVLHMEKIVGRPSLVVCPKTLLYNWKIEAEKFFPDLQVLIYDGPPPERESLRKKIKKHDLIIVGYGTLRQDQNFFSEKNTRFNYAVLDEAQAIKNQASKNAQAVKKINADYRLAITGTPLENNVSELWSIYDFLMPGFLGNREYFFKHFHKPIMNDGDRQALEHLRGKVTSFLLRRTKNEVLKELPPKIEQIGQCRLSEAQNILYQQILAKIRGEIFETVKQKGFQSSQIHILAGLTKLRQACNHPALLIKDKDFRKYESAKLEMCLELTEEIAKNGRKVLIFSQFTQMLDIVSAALNDKKISHLYLSGKTKNRQELVDKFNNDPTVSVFLISLKAGGTGLNLTAADTVIIFDPWWNPSVENQAVDRAHRIGQTKTVNVYRLFTVGTIEEKIQALKKKKQSLFDAIINESGDLFKKLTWDDVRELFSE